MYGFEMTHGGRRLSSLCNISSESDSERSRKELGEQELVSKRDFGDKLGEVEV